MESTECESPDQTRCQKPSTRARRVTENCEFRHAKMNLDSPIQKDNFFCLCEKLNPQHEAQIFNEQRIRTIAKFGLGDASM
jgi:hypothetical protein